MQHIGFGCYDKGDLVQIIFIIAAAKMSLLTPDFAQWRTSCCKYRRQKFGIECCQNVLYAAANYKKLIIKI